MFHTRDHTSKIIISFSARCCVRHRCVRYFYASPLYLSFTGLSPLPLSFSLSLFFFLSFLPNHRRFFGPTTPVPLYESRDPREKRARRRCRCVCVLSVWHTCVSVLARVLLHRAASVCVRAESAHARIARRLCVGERARACVRGGARVSVSHLTTTRVI